MEAPQIDLQSLKDAIEIYLNQHGIVTAAGPLAGAAFVRTFFWKTKGATLMVVASGAWMAVRSISTPMLQLMQDQFGYLQQLLGQ